MAVIFGHDRSRYQGKLTQHQCDLHKKAGSRFFWVRFSQGTGYRDPEAVAATKLLQANGFPVGPYHFTTNADPAEQFKWFEYCTRGFQFDLPPMMDVEYYSGGRPTTTTNLLGVEVEAEEEVEVITVFRYDVPPVYARYGALIRQYSIPTEAIVDSLGRQLTTWMGSYQPKLKKFPYPAIYTNVSSGNAVFRTASMSRYPLIVANWGVSTPSLPKVWKSAGKWLSWQDKVESGAPYGITGQLDHQVWGNLMPFPGDEPTPTPNPLPDTGKVRLDFDVAIYEGQVKREG